jgi:hypothetical protein
VHPGGDVPTLFAYVLALSLPMTCLHELGHALAAARRLGDPVHISVGGTRRLLRIRFRRLTMAVNALPYRASLGGYDSIDASRASARDLLLVALAGPLASLTGFLAAAIALSSVSTSGSWHDLLWAAAVTNLAACVSIVPLELRERRGGPRLRTDGRLVLDAVRARRALRGL